MTEKTQEKIIAIMNEEAERIGYGKLLIEVTVHNGVCTNIQLETRRSLNIPQGSLATA